MPTNCNKSRIGLMNKDDEKKDKAKESMETFGFSSRK